MRYFLVLALCLATAAPAAAQMYPGEDVTVNPAAAGTQVLLYPDGKYVRIVRPLLQPGQTFAPIKLHMPAHHRVVLREPRRSMIAAAPEPEAPVAAAPRSERPAPVREAERTPPPVRAVENRPAPRHHLPATVADNGPSADNAPAADLSELDDTIRPANPAPVKPGRKPPSQHMASIAPPPARTPPARSPAHAAMGSRRGSILFAPNATDPTGTAIQIAKNLAKDIDAALGQDSTRVQLVAYGGPRGDRTSDSRRLSLRRALIVRQLLIDDGVPSERIDVRAMGGVDDDGPADRVDVFLKS